MYLAQYLTGPGTSIVQSVESSLNGDRIPEPESAPLTSSPASPLHIHTAIFQPSNSQTNNSSVFEGLLAITDLPPPGPSYYTARRTLWLTPRPSQIRRQEPSTGRQRLENLLNRPGAVGDEGVWKSGIEKVWNGLAAGGRLKRRLPLKLVMKIIHAAWLRDPDTWPPGAVAPESDEVLEENPFFSMRIYPPGCVTPTEYSSSTTPTWTAVSGVADPMGDEERASGLVVAAEI